MAEPSVPSQAQSTTVQTNDKELNFRHLEAKYERQREQDQRQLAQERQARLEAERKVEEALQRKQESEEDDSEPYVDHKKLKKTLNNFGQQQQQQTQGQIDNAVKVAIADERKQNWMKNNADFYEVLKHADKFAQHDPELAETILEMPDTFERQKLVYKNIKALGLHKPASKEPSIQETIDANRRSPSYQPTSVGSAPHQSKGDFSQTGQKSAYDKMQELKGRMRF